MRINPFKKKYKGKYDFLDLGSKKGGSIDWCQRNYGGKGLGVDYNPEWVEIANKNDLDSIQGDAMKVDFPKNSFKYVVMMDFLEHLADEKETITLLENCKKWSRDFFFIHHPSFEDIEYLKKLGLKIDWTDGYGHSNPLTIKDYKRIFKKLGLNDYEIKPVKPMLDSSNEHIIPLKAPHNTHMYSEALGPKKIVKFDHPVYSRFEIVVKTR